MKLTALELDPASIALVSVVVGAFIGILGSLSLEWWKQEREKKELKDRIREELQIILQEVSSDYQKEAFHSRAFFMEAFEALKQYLIRNLDAKTFKAVRETYIKIHQLSFQDSNSTKYKEAVEAIRKTIELLK